MRTALCCVALGLCALAPAAVAQEPDDPSTLDPVLARILADLGEDGAAEAVPLPAAPPPAHTLQPAGPPASALPADPIGDAYVEYHDTGRAPIVATPTHKVEPFGLSYPELVCLPERACDVELEEGEQVAGLVLGDAARWQAQFVMQGKTPHLIIQPSEADVATNAIVVTDRRTYHILLLAPPEEVLEAPTIYHHLRYYYPQQWVRRFEPTTHPEPPAPPELQADDAASALPSVLGPTVELEDLNLSYEIEAPRRRRARLPWQPRLVLDDGSRTFILLPQAAQRGELPVLLGLLDNNEPYPLLTHRHGNWLVVPTTFDRARFVLGTGQSARSLTLVNTLTASGS